MRSTKLSAVTKPAVTFLSACGSDDEFLAITAPTAEPTTTARPCTEAPATDAPTTRHPDQDCCCDHRRRTGELVGNVMSEADLANPTFVVGDETTGAIGNGAIALTEEQKEKALYNHALGHLDPRLQAVGLQ